MDCVRFIACCCRQKYKNCFNERISSDLFALLTPGLARGIQLCLAPHLQIKHLGKMVHESLPSLRLISLKSENNIIKKPNKHTSAVLHH